MTRRLAQGLTDAAPRAWRPAELYQLYCRGFQDGAGRRAMRVERGADTEAYQRGYRDGQVAGRKAATAYAAEVGYEPTVLRTQGEPSGSG